MKKQKMIEDLRKKFIFANVLISQSRGVAKLFLKDLQL